MAIVNVSGEKKSPSPLSSNVFLRLQYDVVTNVMNMEIRTKLEIYPINLLSGFSGTVLFCITANDRYARCLSAS